MNRLYLIGLTGRAGAGKDTAALGPINVFGYTRVTFGDQVKHMLAAGLDLDIEIFHDPILKEQPIDWLGKSPRQLMQTLGTDWGRRMAHPRIWVLLLERLLAAAPHGTRIIVPDVRFEDEADFIRTHGGEVWHVQPTGDRRTTQHAEHASERGIAFNTEQDRVLINNAGIHALQSAACAMAAEYEAHHGRIVEEQPA